MADVDWRKVFIHYMKTVISEESSALIGAPGSLKFVGWLADFDLAARPEIEEAVKEAFAELDAEL